jgi:4-hydroxy-tetrahydrodipicolinate synthase
LPDLVRALFGAEAASVPVRAALAVFDGRPFIPTMKAILAARSGDPGWLRVRPPLRAAVAGEGAALAARLPILRRSEAA